MTHGGRDLDRLGVLAELQQALPSLRPTLLRGNLDTGVSMAGFESWASAVGRDDAQTAGFEPRWLAFDHPQWIVYCSGTTGLPKPSVHGHGHGGMILVQLQLGRLHNDVGCSYHPNSFE